MGLFRRHQDVTEPSLASPALDEQEPTPEESEWALEVTDKAILDLAIAESAAGKTMSIPMKDFLEAKQRQDARDARRSAPVSEARPPVSQVSDEMSAISNSPENIRDREAIYPEWMAFSASDYAKNEETGEWEYRRRDDHVLHSSEGPTIRHPKGGGFYDDEYYLQGHKISQEQWEVAAPVVREHEQRGEKIPEEELITLIERPILPPMGDLKGAPEGSDRDITSDTGRGH